MTAHLYAAEIRAQRLHTFIGRAQAIAESDPVIRIYAAPEWGELHEDGQLWLAAVVREAIAQSAEAGYDQVETGDDRPLLPIPIAAASRIAHVWGYDQVIVIGRRTGTDPAPNGEHISTYGVDPTHCGVAARVGEALRVFMGWPTDPGDALRVRAERAEAELQKLKALLTDDIVAAALQP